MTAELITSLEEFIGVLRSPATKKCYAYGIHRVLEDPDDFVKSARVDPRAAEEKLISFILSSSESMSAGSIATYLVAVHSFLNFQGVNLNWARIFKFVPLVKRISDDRAPTVDEVRRALGFADPRERAVVLMMASSGMRVGAFDWLRVGDVIFLPNGMTRLEVYRGEPEEYVTFASREATSALQEYLQSRQDSCEHIFPDSPLIRNKWDDNTFLKAAFGKPKSVSSAAIADLLWRLWLKAGVRSKGIRGEFKYAHGLRKFFKTNSVVCAQHGDQDIEVMMGHLQHYYKPTLEHLQDQYAISEPYLTIRPQN